MFRLIFLERDEYAFSVSEQRVIQDIAEEWSPVLRRELPLLPRVVNVTVYPGTLVIPETGETGHTHTEDWVSITISPTDPRGIETIAKERLRSTLAHESCHAARRVARKGLPLDGRVIAAAAAEGLSTAFERDITGLTPPWGSYDPEAADTWLAELLTVPPEADSRPWLFRHPDGRRWIGYLAGTRLVDRATATTGLGIQDLLARSADEILAMAGLA